MSNTLANHEMDESIKRNAKGPDFELHLHGSICILNALTEDAQNWVNEFLPDDALTWGVNGTVIEPRYLEAILEGINQAELEVD